MSELLPLDIEAEKLRGYKAIIISGGPKSVHDDDAPAYDPNIFTLDIPILGELRIIRMTAHILLNIFWPVIRQTLSALELLRLFLELIFSIVRILLHLEYVANATTVIFVDLPTITDLFVVVAGICYGMQMIAKEFGGEIQKKDVREDGPTQVEIDTLCPLFA